MRKCFLKICFQFVHGRTVLLHCKQRTVYTKHILAYLPQPVFSKCFSSDAQNYKIHSPFNAAILFLPSKLSVGNKKSTRSVLLVQETSRTQFPDSPLAPYSFPKTETRCYSTLMTDCSPRKVSSRVILLPVTRKKNPLSQPTRSPVVQARVCPCRHYVQAPSP